jgi:nitrogen-specific signal transduction histidine kinase
MTSGVLTADSDVCVTSANRTAVSTLGLGEPDLIARPVAELFGACSPPARAIESTLPGTEQQVEFPFTRSDGRSVHMGLTVIRTADAPPGMDYVMVFRDVGDRLRQRSDARRMERLASMGNMVAGFAHEVRNPLAGIQALTEALLGEMPAEDHRREYASMILLQLARVERFVKASLEFGQPKLPVRRPHTIGSLLTQAVEVFETRSGGSAKGLQIETDEDLPRVMVDETQIVESLVALLQNAQEAVGAAGNVRLRTGVDEETLGGKTSRVVRIDVLDTGPGIVESHLGRIFDPFFTTKARGIGLGLSVAQNLVGENGGRLLVRSRPGVETVFSVQLPEAAS